MPGSSASSGLIDRRRRAQPAEAVPVEGVRASTASTSTPGGRIADPLPEAECTRWAKHHATDRPSAPARQRVLNGAHQPAHGALRGWSPSSSRRRRLTVCPGRTSCWPSWSTVPESGQSGQPDSSCEALGAARCSSGARGRPLCPAHVRASMGAFFALPVIRLTGLARWTRMDAAVGRTGRLSSWARARTPPDRVRTPSGTDLRC